MGTRLLTPSRSPSTSRSVVHRKSESPMVRLISLPLRRIHSSQHSSFSFVVSTTSECSYDRISRWHPMKPMFAIGSECSTDRSFRVSLQGMAAYPSETNRSKITAAKQLTKETPRAGKQEQPAQGLWLDVQRGEQRVNIKYSKKLPS
jgi:hypothetical protein